VKKLTILVTAEDESQIGRIVEEFPFSSRHGVSRLALRIGIAELHRNPDRLVVELRKEVRS
jgi:hypothetical protein